MGYIIKRSEINRIKIEKHWILLYGRRKVGKTFLLKDLCKFKNYYYIKKDLSILSNQETISTQTMIQETKKLLLDNQLVVIDEFQRLNETVLEDLSILHPKGKLILSGSSLRVIKKIFEPRSALLGFFTPFKIGFISPSDTLLNLQKSLKDNLLIELSTFLREPWLIPIYNNEELIKFIYKLINESKHIITALIGEIFTEEERELTKKYEAILNLIGSGIWNTKELTSILYSRGIISEPSPTHIIQYIKNLEEMELVESIKLHKSKGRYYRLFSPLMNIYYYLDSRYDISDRVISFEEVKPTLQKLINLEIQNFIADLFSEIYDGRKEYFISQDKEVDFVITKRNKPELIGEVKWKEIDQTDINKFKKNSERLYGKKIMICKGSVTKDKDIEILPPNKLMLLLQKLKSEVKL